IDEKNYKVSYTNKLAQSEPFTFISDCNVESRVTNPLSSQPFIILSKTVDSYVFAVEDNKINIKYIEGYIASQLKYKIYNWKREELLDNTFDDAGVTIDYGWNYLTIDLSNASPELAPNVNPGDKNFYQLEVET